MVGLGGPEGDRRGGQALQAEGIIQKPGQARKRFKLSHVLASLRTSWLVRGSYQGTLWLTKFLDGFPVKTSAIGETKKDRQSLCTKVFIT